MRILLTLIIDFTAFFICIFLISSILIPLQVVSSVLFTHLSGLLLIASMFVSFFAGLTFGSGHDEEPYVLDTFYHDGGIPMFKKSDGFWYDLAGNKYKDRNGEEVVKRKH